MNKKDKEIMEKLPKNKIGIACFDYTIQGIYKEILNDVKKISSKFESKIEVKYEQGEELKERVVYYSRNEKTGLCLTFAVDEDKEEFILYYIYRSKIYSLPDDEKDTREIFKKYKLDEYDCLLDTLKSILNGFRIKTLMEVTALKIKIAEV